MNQSPRKKYQIFISSTFTDLQEERTRVFWEILRLRYIPAGMENFTASDERGWKTIQRAIDDSDYYVLILGGRYGSIREPGIKSWTHHEYEYAISKEIPVLGFLRNWASISANVADPDRHYINEFRELIQTKHSTSFWSQKEDLASAVSASLYNHIIDDDNDNQSRPGWYRGDSLPPPSREITEELARLSAENANLRQENERLHQSKDSQTINYLRNKKHKSGISFYDIFVAVSDHFVSGIDASFFYMIFPTNLDKWVDKRKERIDWILIEFRTTGLLRVDRNPSSNRPNEAIYTLTDLGAAIAFMERKISLNPPQSFSEQLSNSPIS